MNTKQGELELVLNQKDEYEKMLKQIKNEVLESQRQAADYYQQLLKVKENLHISVHEQKMISQEVTTK